MQKVKNTIPVYDICALSAPGQAQLLVTVAPFGEYLASHPNLHLPHRHSFYHLVFFSKGAGYHTIDFEKFTVTEGQIYFMMPGQVHSWNFEGDTDGYVVNFSDAFFQSFLSEDHYLERFHFFTGIAGESVIELADSRLQAVTKIFETIIGEMNGDAAYSLDYIRVCLIELFILVSRQRVAEFHNQTPIQNHLILFNFRKLVDSYYHEKRLPKEYAGMLYITPNHLNALCKDLLGKPAGEVIRDRILLEAKRLLVNAEESIAAIAARLDFSDNSHFTKFFKKCTGISPEEFRKGL